MAPSTKKGKSTTKSKSMAPPKASKKKAPKANATNTKGKNVAQGCKRQAPDDSEDSTSDEELVTKASSRKKAKHDEQLRSDDEDVVDSDGGDGGVPGDEDTEGHEACMSFPYKIMLTFFY